MPPLLATERLVALDMSRLKRMIWEEADPQHRAMGYQAPCRTNGTEVMQDV